MCEICPELTIKIPDDVYVIIVNFEQISHVDVVLMVLLLTLNKSMPAEKQKTFPNIRSFNKIYNFYKSIVLRIASYLLFSMFSLKAILLGFSL